jgi:diadenosine tetraphosphate (Ap4A) HIT family hydrolase
MKQGHLLGLTKDKYCIFCKIIRKEEQAFIIFEDSTAMIFLDP